MSATTDLLRGIAGGRAGELVPRRQTTMSTGLADLERKVDEAVARLDASYRYEIECLKRTNEALQATIERQNEVVYERLKTAEMEARHREWKAEHAEWMAQHEAKVAALLGREA